MPFKLDDGYTLSGQTSGRGNAGEPQDVVKFTYRPPVGSELSDYRFKVNQAKSGKEQHEVRVAFLLTRLQSWDITDKSEKTVPIVSAVFDKLPDPIIIDMVEECAKWKPREQAEAGGNSPVA